MLCRGYHRLHAFDPGVSFNFNMEQMSFFMDFFSMCSFYGGFVSLRHGTIFQIIELAKKYHSRIIPLLRFPPVETTALIAFPCLVFLWLPTLAPLRCSLFMNEDKKGAYVSSNSSS